MTKRRRLFRTLIALGAVVVVSTGLVSAQATPDGGALGAAWTATHDGPRTYPQVHIEWDVPITMSDGTVLKGNVYRPADAAGVPIAEQTPTIVSLTPYTKLVSNLADSAQSIPVLSDLLVEALKGFDLSAFGLGGVTEMTRALPAGLGRVFSVDRKLVQSGYTQVVVDVRGTGFSQGIWQVFGEREQQDGVEVVEWAARQPWSTGSVGMTGVSYSAINQLQTAERKPEALKAIFPVVPGSDLLRDIAATGGGVGIGFLPMWLLAVNSAKLVPNVQSMLTGSFDWKWLADRAADPLTFFNYLLAALTIPSIAEVPDYLLGLLQDDSLIRTAWLGQPERIEIPTFIYGGWHDIFTYSSPRAFRAVNVPAGQKKLIMGDTYHLTSGSGLGLPGGPPRLDVLQRAWFDKWLKGIDNGIDDYADVTVWQQGGGWTSTTEFPRPGMDYRRMYLSPEVSGTARSVHDGSLTAAPGGAARLTVAPGLTGVCSRDSATGTAGLTAALDLCAKDDRINESNGLTFTSAPVTEPTQISGPIAVHLNTVLDATDGYWAVTVNDVAPDGRSTVWTSGQLQASLRKVNEAKSTRSPNGDYTDPYPILTLADRLPLVPGEPTIVDIGLPATDGILQPGHRLRIDVYALNFPRGLPLRPLLNESELKPQHLELDPNRPSWVNIPVSGNPGW
ncbi:CocE/NonD family hydrolase [Nocardia goodfellowii]|uniref:CocE/NonD family hydrolase n=1 Tax=Nocardia goodfellowii TaxID=882446 RepID=A0ABS4QNE5_9NOCA|nr:CocE/NonD family hydrolase [Nocardia goodfellowii]MBP2192191.1 putative CocE/NonD family hydrolase [Nocardia goodfellowii]